MARTGITHGQHTTLEINLGVAGDPVARSWTILGAPLSFLEGGSWVIFPLRTHASSVSASTPTRSERYL